VRVVLLILGVLDELEGLQGLSLSVETLKIEGALFDTAHNVVAFKRRRLRRSRVGKELLPGIIGDLRRREFAFGDGL